MIIHLKKFGNLLVSRPAGREAWLAAQAYLLDREDAGPVEIDFSGVDVLTPSWADEFLTKLVEQKGVGRIRFRPTDNSSVNATLVSLELVN